MERVLASEVQTAGLLSLGDFVLDAQRLELRRADGTPAELRKQALDVLLVLAAQAGHVVGKDELLRRVWPDVVVTEDSLVQAIGDIRRLLGDERHRLVRTVPRRGYLLMPDAPPPAPGVALPSVSSAALPAESAMSSAVPGAFHGGASPDPAVTAAASGRPRLPLVAAALALLVLLTAAIWLVVDRPARVPAEPPQIAVLAMRDRSGSAEGASLGQGLTEDIVLELGRNPGLNVVSHQSSLAVSGKGLPVAELGRQLRAQYLVDGVLQRNGDRVDLQVELIDARADKVLWVSSHQTEGGQIVEARDAVVKRVAGTLLSKLRVAEQERVARQAPATLDVYALTQKGLALKHRFTAEATREGRAGLERALAIDPNYAPAWYVLGWLNAVDGHFKLTGEWSAARAGEAIAQINRSIELDGSNPAAWSGLSIAYSLAGRSQEQFAAAQRATELGPGDAEAWLFHATAALRVKPPEVALASMRRALAMNPIPPAYFDATHAQVLWANGDNDGALREAETCTRRAPRFPFCRFVSMMVFAETGRLDEAREKASALAPQSVRYGTLCKRWSGSAPNVERCNRLAQAAGLPQ